MMRRIFILLAVLGLWIVPSTTHAQLGPGTLAGSFLWPGSLVPVPNGGGGGGSPGGTPNQIQYNNAGSFGGFTVTGDGTINTSTGVLTITKAGGVAFGPLATQATPCLISQGCTGATTAAAALAALGAANSGVNSNITQITGLTTPLSVAQGGCAATTTAQCKINLGAAASGANTDITSAASLPLNGLLAATGNYAMGNHTLTGVLAATVANEPLTYGQSGAQLVGLTLTGTGIGVGAIGEINNIFNVKAFGAVCNGDGSTDDIVALQAAYDAACAVTAISGVRPAVYIPYGVCQEIAKGLQADCAGGTVDIIGDEPGTSQLTALGHFVAIDNTATSAYSGLGTMTVASLIGATNPFWNFAQGSYPIGAWWLNLGHALFPTSSGVPNQLNGLPGSTIRFYLKPPSVDANPHTIVNSSNLTGDGVHVANQAVNVSYTGTTLTAGFRTGSSRGAPNSIATGTIASSTLVAIEIDEDCGNTGFMAVFFGTPGGASSHGTPVACTGNILQELNEEFDIAEPSPGSNQSGPNMQGAIGDFEIEKVALHTCPSGTCPSFTMPNFDYTADGNTLVLGPTAALSHSGQVEAWTMAFPAGAQMPVMSDSNAQDSAADVKNLTVTSPTESLLYQLRPDSTVENDNLLTVSNSAYAGLQLYNNVYNAQLGNVLIDNAGRFGYIEQNDSSMFTWRLRARFALTDYLGAGPLNQCEITVGSSATIVPVQIQTNQGIATPSLTDCEPDNESGYTGPFFYSDTGVPTDIRITGGNWNSGGSASFMNLPVGSPTYFHIGLHDLILDNTGSVTMIGGVTGNTRVTADNVSYQAAGPPTPAQLCGTSFAANCFVTDQAPAPVVYGVPPVPTGTSSPVLGASSSPVVVTAADTTSGDWQAIFVGTFNNGGLGTLPTGWSIAPGCPGHGGTGNNTAYWLVHLNGGSEPSTNSFPFNGAGSLDFYPIGIHNTSGPDGQAACTSNNVSPIPVAAPTGTTSASDVVLALGGLSGGSGVSYTTGPTATTWVTGGSSYFGLGKYYTGTGSVVGYTVTGGGGLNNVGGQIAFGPVQAGLPLIMSGAQPAVGVGLRPPEFTVSTLPATCTAGDEIRVTDYAAIATIQACSGHGSGTGKVPAICQPSNVWECF